MISRILGVLLAVMLIAGCSTTTTTGTAAACANFCHVLAGLCTGGTDFVTKCATCFDDADTTGTGCENITPEEGTVLTDEQCQDLMDELLTGVSPLPASCTNLFTAGDV